MLSEVFNLVNQQRVARGVIGAQVEELSAGVLETTVVVLQEKGRQFSVLVLIGLAHVIEL